jgi:segregation and condensation protein A
LTENPTFTLSGVVKSRGGQLDFSGPLSLILQLLSRNKIEARDISVSLILDQYLAWLGEAAALDLHIASEFVAMASYLAYIKTKTLLGEDEPEELTELITTLERIQATDVYVQIKSVITALEERFRAGSGYITKPQEMFEPDLTYKLSHEPEELCGALAAILEREAVFERAVSRAREAYPHAQQYPIDEKLAEILARVRTCGSADLSRIFAECGDRSEMVAAFVAVLELCSEGRIYISDDCVTIMGAYGEREAGESGGT